MAIEVLEARDFNVGIAVYELTNLNASEVPEHTPFLKDHLEELEKCTKSRPLFARLNGCWNYLSPQLLYHTVNRLDITKAKEQMKLYDKDLETFRNRTPLQLFCQTERQYIEPPEELVRVVVKFGNTIPGSPTLQHVESFRQIYARHHKLRDFALILYALKVGSVIMLVAVPSSVRERLRNEVPNEILTKFGIVQLDIDGECVYSVPTAPKSENSGMTARISISFVHFFFFPFLIQDLFLVVI